MSELSTPATKHCPKCTTSKPTSEFHRDKSTKDGLCSWCKTCSSIKTKRWREANPGKDAARHKQWHEANPERIATGKKRWKKANPEKAADQRRRHKCRLKGFIARLWSSLQRRCIDGSHPNWKNKSTKKNYLDKGIELRITREELTQLALENWEWIGPFLAAGGVVDFHRPNNNGHYSLDNVEFLPHEEHMELHRKKSRKKRKRGPYNL